jgi:hypothetical protein
MNKVRPDGVQDDRCLFTGLGLAGQAAQKSLHFLVISALWG